LNKSLQRLDVEEAFKGLMLKKPSKATVQIVEATNLPEFSYF